MSRLAALIVAASLLVSCGSGGPQEPVPSGQRVVDGPDSVDHGEESTAAADRVLTDPSDDADAGAADVETLIAPQVSEATDTSAMPAHLVLSGWDSALTPDQQAALAIFPGRLRPAFYAVGCAETGWTLNAVGDTTLPTGPAFGWAQIERPWFDGTAYPSVPAFPAAWKTSAVGSARGALIIFDHQGLDAWSTWKAGGRTAAGTLAWARAHGNCLVE